MGTKTIIAPITSGGLPATGLSPTIRIRRLDTDALVVTDDAMLEVGDGWYKYQYPFYSGTLDYAIRVDGTTSVPDGERFLFAGNESFVEDIWDQPLAFHSGVNGVVVPSGSTDGTITMGGARGFVFDIEGGRWFIDETVNQMVFFKNDNTTEIARFDLKDSDGLPASDDVFERVRSGSVNLV